jgi:hypothetical protein
MFKLIVILLVALGAAFYFPSSRAVLLDKAGPLLNPAFRLATKAELEKVSRDLETYERETNRLPPPREFTAWLEDRHAGDATHDSWGNSYVLVVRSNAFDVISLGPDGRQGTRDDLVNTRDRR